MAKQIVNVGVEVGDPAADSVRDSFIKVNSNTNEIYDAGPVGTDIKFINNKMYVDPYNVDLYIEANGNGRIILSNDTHTQIVEADTITAKNINISDELTADVINAKFILGLDNISLTSLVVADTLETENIRINQTAVFEGLTTFDSNIVINGGPSQFLRYTDGDNLNPTDFFTIDGETGNVVISNNLEVKGETRLGTYLNIPIGTAPARSGKDGDLEGDVVYTQNYIYYCYEDWVFAIPPATQPNIWGRTSLDWIP